MKNPTITIALTFMVIMSACGPGTNSPISTFDSPFPKKNFDLTKVLGNQITLKRYSDTLTLNITANKDINTITNSITNDTIFSGKVCKFRGLYYFNTEFNDSTYWIYAVKIEDHLIYGFEEDWSQIMYIDSAIRSGNNKKLVKFINSDTSIILLHPEKHAMKKLFNTIVTKFTPDTILYNQNSTTKVMETESVRTEIDPEEFNYMLKAFPNPTKNFINIELQQKTILKYKLSDLSGKTILEGQFNEINNKLDMSKTKAGVYALTIYNVADKQKETIKIVKSM